MADEGFRALMRVAGLPADEPSESVTYEPSGPVGGVFGRLLADSLALLEKCEWANMTEDEPARCPVCLGHDHRPGRGERDCEPGCRDGGHETGSRERPIQPDATRPVPKTACELATHLAALRRALGK